VYNVQGEPPEQVDGPEKLSHPASIHYALDDQPSRLLRTGTGNNDSFTLDAAMGKVLLHGAS
jgi:hypothetical protein